MKKTYQAPETMLCVVIKEQAILTGSESSRAAEGTPTTQNGGSLPKGVGETENNPDPFGGHGQDGNTTRAKKWTDDWDLSNWELPNWE